MVIAHDVPALLHVLPQCHLSCLEEGLEELTMECLSREALYLRRQSNWLSFGPWTDQLGKKEDLNHLTLNDHITHGFKSFA